ncbi:MAG TPA: hypothetical protein DCE71_01100 [Parachlamydiales bacterium]|nr:hypothetical protein [Parachlamydiales bacterium]
MSSTMPNFLRIPSAGGAFSYDQNGERYSGQRTKLVGNFQVTTASAPSVPQKQDANSYRMVRDIYINSTTNYLPYADLIECDKWIWQHFFSLTEYGEETELRSTPFTKGTMQNVAIQGVKKTIEFRFRNVVKQAEAEMLSRFLNLDIPTSEQVQSYVNEAIELSLLIPLPEHASTGYAPKNTMGLVAFYWLRNEKQPLEITTENQVYSLQPAKDKDLLVTYPCHPNAQDEKVIAAAALLKKQFETTLKRTFEAEHIPHHPIRIQEPNTITSNLPPPLFR